MSHLQKLVMKGWSEKLIVSKLIHMRNASEYVTVQGKSKIMEGGTKLGFPLDCPKICNSSNSIKLKLLCCGEACLDDLSDRRQETYIPP